MADFHFIRPWFLLTIVLLVWVFWLIKRSRIVQSGWANLLPKHLSKVLIADEKISKQTSLVPSLIAGFLAIVALAGPTWKKIPQPVFNVDQGSVLILDLSYSMLATDISPNRLTRAKFKMLDLLDQLNDGTIGLVAYAGDAFIISPLTEDINNIKLLLPSLSPEIMPELGSYPLAALDLADKMLANAGHLEGNIYWFTDGIDGSDSQEIQYWLQQHPHSLNILGIGTTTGAPIKLSDGQLLKDASGSIVVPKLPTNLLRSVARKGLYRTMANDNSDITAFVSNNYFMDQNKNETEGQKTGDQWHESGPYLLLLAIPLMLLLFRKGVLFAIIPVCMMLSTSPETQANEFTDTAKDVWQDLWLTKNQQGAEQFKEENYEQAAEKFDDPMWRGSSLYKAGNYEQAAEAFSQHDTSTAAYNQGNALMKLNQFDPAIEAYQRALAKDPLNKDAQSNLALAEQLKKQQEEQQKNQNNDQQDDQDQQDKDKNKKQDQDDQQQDQQQNQDQQGEGEQEDQEKQDQQQKDQQDKGKDQEKDAEAKEQESKDGKSKEEKEQQAKLAESQLTDEEQQKYEQLLRKVTDDPYLLLRNKMQLEYEKRRGERSSVRGAKKW